MNGNLIVRVLCGGATLSEHVVNVGATPTSGLGPSVRHLPLVRLALRSALDVVMNDSRDVDPARTERILRGQDPDGA